MNLEEVAKRAGVSVATVSRVLNNKSVVKKSTRTRVMKLAAKLNYYPDLNARSLARGRSRTIGMIASNLENPFFFDIFRSLEASAHAHGYELFVTNTDYRREQLVRSVRLMIGRRVAGLAVIVSEMDDDLIRELDQREIPTVFYDVGAAKHKMSNIRVNYRHGTRQIVDYLQSLGHSRFAFIGHHPSLSPTNERQTAFLEAVSHYPNTGWRIVTNEDSLDGGRNAARELLADNFQASGIVCVNDFMALGVLRELRTRGVRIPGDMSVTGFDNIKLSQYCDPPLTTLHIPRDQIGQLAFSALVPDSAVRKVPGRELVVEPELVLRESTGPLEKHVKEPAATS